MRRLGALLAVAGVAAAARWELALDDPADRRAFTAWFTLIAEAQYVAPSREVGDCAALLRFAYREALRKHDGAWAAALRLPAVAPMPPVAKYNYPRTPLGPNIFRVRDGVYAEFADAETLMRLNTRRIGSSLRRAEPGDLLFYRQIDRDLPFHAMIYLGPSRLENDAGPFVVYHTGPVGSKPGEIRRPSLAELMRHPEPRWRPVEGNPGFLGVFRWEILTGGGEP
jgi:uncharacterized protein YfaT (DUF1175 family)